MTDRNQDHIVASMTGWRPRTKLSIMGRPTFSVNRDEDRVTRRAERVGPPTAITKGNLSHVCLTVSASSGGMGSTQAVPVVDKTAKRRTELLGRLVIPVISLFTIFLFLPVDQIFRVR